MTVPNQAKDKYCGAPSKDILGEHLAISSYPLWNEMETCDIGRLILARVAEVLATKGKYFISHVLIGGVVCRSSR